MNVANFVGIDICLIVHAPLVFDLAPSYCHILVMSCFSEDPPLPSDLLATAYFDEPPLPHVEDPPLPSDILGTASEADGPQLQELCNVVQLPCDLLRKRKIYSCCKHNCIQQSSSLAAFKLWEEKKATVAEKKAKMFEQISEYMAKEKERQDSRHPEYPYFGNLICRQGFAQMWGVGHTVIDQLRQHARAGYVMSPVDQRGEKHVRESKMWDIADKFWHWCYNYQSQSFAEDVQHDLESAFEVHSRGQVASSSSLDVEKSDFQPSIQAHHRRAKCWHLKSTPAEWIRCSGKSYIFCLMIGQRGAKQNLLMQQLPVYGKLNGLTFCLSVESLNIKFVTSALGIENGGKEKILKAKREEI